MSVGCIARLLIFPIVGSALLISQGYAGPPEEFDAGRKAYRGGDIVGSMVLLKRAAERMWFGTYRGVSRFDGKTWKSFTPHEGLLEANVYALAVAPNGDIWVGTRRGVARIGKR